MAAAKRGIARAIGCQPSFDVLFPAVCRQSRHKRRRSVCWLLAHKTVGCAQAPITFGQVQRDHRQAKLKQFHLAHLVTILF
jgi:hypothetical protein